MYNIKDLVFDSVKTTSRKWNYDESRFDYGEYISLKVSTIDGLFHSETDSDGYSYWHDNTIRLGSTSTDYFFITKDFPLDRNMQNAVDILNRVAF